MCVCRFAAHKLPIKLLQMPVSCLIVRVIVLCYQIKIVCIEMEMNVGISRGIWVDCGVCVCTRDDDNQLAFALTLFIPFAVISHNSRPFCHIQNDDSKIISKRCSFFARALLLLAFQNIYLLAFYVRLFTEIKWMKWEKTLSLTVTSTTVDVVSMRFYIDACVCVRTRV